MKNIDAIEKHYLLSINPIEFIDSLECDYIFNDWMEKDQYLRFNSGGGTNEETPIYNNIAIVGIYNIVSNLVSIFFHDLLSIKHKQEFSNNIKPFDFNSASINISCNTFPFNSDNNNRSSFTYSFNGESIKIEDYIYTKDMSIYEHRIYIRSINKNDLLRNSLFLYEAIVDNICDKLEYF